MSDSCLHLGTVQDSLCRGIALGIEPPADDEDEDDVRGQGLKKVS